MCIITIILNIIESLDVYTIDKVLDLYLYNGNNNLYISCATIILFYIGRLSATVAVMMTRAARKTLPIFPIVVFPFIGVGFIMSSKNILRDRPLPNTPRGWKL